MLVHLEHTHLAAYLVLSLAALCIASDSVQGLIARNQLNRKWLVLYGVLCVFAYLYARPFIRVGLGSAKRGYINFSTLYIVWLCSAVFYHLPSLETLGLDVRADVSMLIVAFLSSLAALALLAGLHTLAVSLRLLPGRKALTATAGGALAPGAGPGAGRGLGPGEGGRQGGLRQLWVVLLLNSMIIAVACSTYHSFCGNGALLVDTATPPLKAAVCAKWLHPILTAQYPRFSSWMLYGEGSGPGHTHSTGAGSGPAAGRTEPGQYPNQLGKYSAYSQNSARSSLGVAAAGGNGGNGSTGCGDGGDGGSVGGGGGGWQAGYISVDFPLDGRGVQSVPAADVLSPVFTMWVTLVAVYVANIMAGQPGMLDEEVVSSASASGDGANNGGRNRRSSSSSGGGGRLTPAGSTSGAAAGAGRRVPSFRRISSFDRALASVGSGGTAGGGSAAAGGGGANGGGGRKGRHRTLEIKRPINKPAQVLSGARGVATAVAVAAARRSLSSLTRLAASTGRLRRAAAEYVRASHPYLPALLHKVRDGMAALEPNHLAAELAEATGLPPSLARELTRGSSFANLSTAVSGAAANANAAATPSYPLLPYRAGSGSWPGGGGGAASGGSGGGGGGGPLACGAGGGEGPGSGGAGVGRLGAVKSDAVPSAAQPDFLDMVPWWSGTSADLFKTLFDLMVSVKLFLGRFDMRTMQAATAASMADSFNDTPSEGDGFTYEHLDDRRELWLDFMADTGDGGNPTYAVASALAAPVLTVAVSEDVPLPLQPLPAQALGTASGAGKAQGKPVRGGDRAGAAEHGPSAPGGRGGRGGSGNGQGTKSGGGSGGGGGGCLSLPRGDVLVIGGDLAYPNPSRETYQQRLFRPFEDALPPPPHFHPGRLVVHKPDLPPAWGVQEAALPGMGDLRGLSPRSSRAASSAALRRYAGPCAFAIPGNHDWIDGLETFTREIQHKGWLGGWLLPQEKSYFALRLPAGWWLFGFDLALVQDIDMQQYRYFANVVEQRMEPDDQVILITHEPLWLLEWFWQRRHGSNLRQLVRGHLRGRARLHLSGDIHFYMRHSWVPTQPPPPPPPGQSPPAPPPAVTSLSMSSQQQTQQQQQQRRQGQGQQEAPPALSRGGWPVGQCRAAGELGRVSGAPERSEASGTTACGSGPSDDMCCRSSASGDTARLPLCAATNLSSLAPAFPGQHHVVCVGAAAAAEAAAAAATAAADVARGVGGSIGASSGCPSSDVVGGSSDEDSDGGVSGVSGGGGGGHWTLAAARGGGAAGRVVPDRRLPPVGLGYEGDGGNGRGRPPARPLAPLRTHAPPPPAAAAAAEPDPSSRRLGQRAAPPPHLLMEGDTAAAAAGGGGPGGGAAASAVSYSGRPATEPCAGCRARLTWARHPHDPEHLVVNGGGGAFLHPTHVFAAARFPAPEDPAAEATAGLYAAIMLPCTCGIYAPGDAIYGGPPGGRLMPLPAAASPVLTAAPQQPPSAPAPSAAQLAAAGGAVWLGGGADGAAGGAGIGVGHHGGGGGGGGGGITGYAAMGPDGEYVCRACYPSPATSLHLGRKNLHVFRLRNSRFDVIGGVFYFLLVVSVLPRCSHLAEVLEADTPGRALSLLGAAYLDTLGAILGRSYLSAAALVLMFLITLGLARGGGVGAGKPPAEGGKGSAAAAAGAAAGAARNCGAASPAAPRPLLPARLGGFGLQLTFAVAHTMTHLSLAIVLLLLLELGVETCIKYERLGADGPHSLYNWYRAYEEEHFPDPMGLRAFLERCTLGLYPRALQAAMGLYDVPELIAVARTAMCAAGGSLDPISRLQAVSYYAGMLAYYWLLATPAMGFVFGLYLYTSVCWFHVHYDEAFSSLREASCKSFCRLHIDCEGDLRLYTLALDEVSTRWREDPRWRGPNGGGCPGVAAHEAHYPSRWLPARTDTAAAAAAAAAAPGRDGGGGGAGLGASATPAAAAVGGLAGPSWRLVDYVHIPRKQV